MTTLEGYICKHATHGTYVYIHNTCSDDELYNNNFHLSINNKTTFTKNDPPKVLLSPILHNETCKQNLYLFKTTKYNNIASTLEDYHLQNCYQIGPLGGGTTSRLKYLASRPNFLVGPSGGPVKPDPDMTTCTTPTMPKFANNQTTSMYRILDDTCWPSMLRLLKTACNTGIQMNRIYLGFFNPTIQYEKGDHKLDETTLPDFNNNTAFKGDPGKAFTSLKEWITNMRGAGVEIYISMGGWNYNCYPYAYMFYSIGTTAPKASGDTGGPNWYKIEPFGGVSRCKEDNQYCYVCEDEGIIKDSDNLHTAMSIFPELGDTNYNGINQTWNAAKKYITTSIAAAGPPPSTTTGGSGTPNYPEPKWPGEKIFPGEKYKDLSSGIISTVPGYQVTKDPYKGIVDLAFDLGATGIDIDYEEMWHADMFRKDATPPVGMTGSFTLYETVYKYLVIVKTILLHIDDMKQPMYISTTPGVVGAWGKGTGGSWWGGNLKGLWRHVNIIAPDIYNKLAEHDGLNVMSYDVATSPIEDPCKSSSCKTLHGQVKFYMDQFRDLQGGKGAASIGFELGKPAYPGSKAPGARDMRLYLTDQDANMILKENPKHSSFYWQWGKPIANCDSTQVTCATSQKTIEERQLSLEMCNTAWNSQDCSGRQFVSFTSE